MKGFFGDTNLQQTTQLSILASILLELANEYICHNLYKYFCSVSSNYKLFTLSSVSFQIKYTLASTYKILCF